MDDSARLRDPHAEAPAEEAPAAEAAPVTVELFDPDHPATPRVDLVGNFDPGKHTRWDHRPAVAPLDLAAIQVNGQPLLSDSAVASLRKTGRDTLKAVLGGGVTALMAAGVSRQMSADLLAWARGRHAAPFALAELAQEGPPAPEAPAEEPTKTAEAPPPAPPPPTATAEEA